jgi:hypothetical protein
MNGHTYQRRLELRLFRISRPHAHPKELRIRVGTHWSRCPGRAQKFGELVEPRSASKR